MLISTGFIRVSLNTAISFIVRRNEETICWKCDWLPEIADKAEDTEEQLKAMHKSIAALSKIDKALVMLYLEDYSYEEISSVLGITANNVAVKMNRIKARLKEESKNITSSHKIWTPDGIRWTEIATQF